MRTIYILNRATKQLEEEKVYGKVFLDLLYGSNPISRIFSFFLLPLLARIPLFSKFHGAFEKSRLSRPLIKPFIKKFSVDTSEFQDPVDSFSSFNEFFIRELKPECRPFISGEKNAIMPADGRYLVYPNVLLAEGFIVKGEKFSLERLLKSSTLAKKYEEGSMVIARLAPVDYHRYHFPCEGVAEKAQLINGPLFSVNPIALSQNIQILTENKRMITPFHTTHFGSILYVEVGATYVGSIRQTYTPNQKIKKGAEKGYFSFGGSCVILLFEPERIQFAEDLVEASSKYIETKALLGQLLGKEISQ